MRTFSTLIVAGVVLAALLVAACWRPLRRRLLQAELERARAEFQRRREYLEAKFFELASKSGKPRGLRWTDCEFGNDVAFGRDRRTGELAAFVSLTIAFEPVVGGGMEEVEAVGNLRAATAVFRYAASAWRTDGRAMFNLTPPEAIAYYHEQLELVAEHHPPRQALSRRS